MEDADWPIALCRQNRRTPTMVREKRKSGATKPPGDFKRRKAKVGKRAVAPMTTTSTKFSSKRIAMPEQSVLKDREEDAPTAAHGRELKLLLAQVKHYSASVRTEATNGLTQLVSKHRGLVQRHLRALILVAAGLFCDAEDAPRSAGHDLLDHLLQAIQVVSDRRVGPFETLLVAHLGSALTSLERCVRFDALVSITLLLGDEPGLDCMHSDHWLSVLLPCLIDVLKGTGTGLRIAAGNGRVLVKSPKKKTSTSLKSSGARVNCLRAIGCLLRAAGNLHSKQTVLSKPPLNPELYRLSSPPITLSGLSRGAAVISDETMPLMSPIDDSMWLGLVIGLKNAWTEATISLSSSASSKPSSGNDTRIGVGEMKECIMVAQAIRLVCDIWGPHKLKAVLNNAQMPLGNAVSHLLGVFTSSRYFPFASCATQSLSTAQELDQTISDSLIQVAVAAMIQKYPSDGEVEEETKTNADTLELLEAEEDEDEDDESKLTLASGIQTVVSILVMKLRDPSAAVNSVSLLNNSSALLLCLSSSGTSKLRLQLGAGKLKSSGSNSPAVFLDLLQLKESFDSFVTRTCSEIQISKAPLKKKKEAQKVTGLINLSNCASQLITSQLKSSRRNGLSSSVAQACEQLPVFLLVLTKSLVDDLDDHTVPPPLRRVAELSHLCFEPILNLLTCLIKAIDCDPGPNGHALALLTAPFYEKYWYLLCQEHTGSFHESLWRRGLQLLSSCASAGCCNAEMFNQGVTVALTRLNDTAALRITLEVIHHNRQQMKPQVFLSFLLSLVEHAINRSEENFDKLIGKKKLNSAPNDDSSEWRAFEENENIILEVCRAVRLAGGSKLLKHLLPQLIGWLEVEVEGDERVEYWIRPRIAVLLLSALFHPVPAFQPNFEPIIEPLSQCLVSLLSLVSIGFNEAHRPMLMTPLLEMLNSSPDIGLKSRFLIVCTTHSSKYASTHLVRALQTVAKQSSSANLATEWASIMQLVVAKNEAAPGQLGRAARALREDIALFCSE